MKKRELIKSIEDAEEYHIEEMDKVTQLVNGEKITDPPERMKENCGFGQWIYGDANNIKQLLGIQLYESMALMHEYWHLKYEKIYDIYYMQDEEGFFDKLFKRGRKPPHKDHELIKKYYHELMQASDDLLETLNASKRRVIALQEGLFKEIV